MENFIFNRYTKMIFGKDNWELLGPEIKKQTSKKILMTYGGGSIKQNGLYEIVCEQLRKHNIEWIELAGIKPNPEVDTCRAGVKLIKEHQIDFILAVGGGSVLDNTKHMAIGAATEHDVWDVIKNQQLLTEISNLPKIGAIITLAATGSEMNIGGVLTNPDTNEKLAMGHDECQPIFTFEDPTQLKTLPLYQRQAGLADTLSHLLEQYFDGFEDTGLTDRMVEAAMINLINYTDAYLNTDDYAAHANFFWTSTIGLNGILRVGRKSGDWTSHSLEHEVSAYTDLTHGIGLSIIHPQVINYYFEQQKDQPETLTKFYNLGKYVFRQEGDILTVAEHANREISKLFYKISGKKTFSDVNVHVFDIINSVDKLVDEQNLVGTYYPLAKKDLIEIYRRCQK